MRLPRRTPDRPPDDDVTWWERLAGVFTWYVLPTFAIGVVVAYVFLAITWHANPPVVPVTGHSMQPKLYAGDLVFIHGVDPTTLKKGDIIAFHTTKAMQQKYDVPAEYVHRIVAIEGKGANLQFRTKGDNVAGPDPFWTFSRDVVGIYYGKISGAGYPLLFFRSRQGKIFGAAVLLVLVLYFVFGIWERRQEAIETNAVTMAQIVEEARELRDSMAVAAGGARAPPPAAPEPLPEPVVETAAPAGPQMLPAGGEIPAGAVLCSRGCHVLLPGAKFDPHTGDPVVFPQPEAPTLVLPQEPEPEPEPLVLEPEYVPVWEREQEPHLAEYELAPAYREEPAPPTPAETVGAYVAGEIDFERLEREIHEAVRTSADVRETMRELVGAIGEYGEHLQSHTAVMRSLAAATGDLQATTSEMREFLASLTTILRSLVARQEPPQT